MITAAANAGRRWNGFIIGSPDGGQTKLGHWDVSVLEVEDELAFADESHRLGGVAPLRKRPDHFAIEESVGRRDDAHFRDPAAGPTPPDADHPPPAPCFHRAAGN